MCVCERVCVRKRVCLCERERERVCVCVGGGGGRCAWISTGIFVFDVHPCLCVTVQMYMPPCANHCMQL